LIQICSVLLAVFVGVKAQTKNIYCQPDLIGYQFENEITERCYQFVSAKDDRKTWDQAREYCQNNGGRLLNIESSDKQTMLENFLKEQENTYVHPAGYNPLETARSTWGEYDPDIWVGAMRDSDGVTWRFDTYSTSRNLRAVIVSWFNYGTDPVLLKQQNEPDRRYATDTCLFMRLTPTIKTIGNLNVSRNAYPWYQQEHCSDPEGYKHPYICEYEGYEYRDPGERSDWVIIIAVLGAFVSCGFLACTIYCLWDKIHTSYNVLQV